MLWCLIRMNQMGPQAARRGGPGMFVFLSPGASAQPHPTSMYSSFGGQGFGSGTSRGGVRGQQSSYDFDTVEVGGPLWASPAGSGGGRNEWALWWQPLMQEQPVRR